jgi:small subunit ribosomal protein S9
MSTDNRIYATGRRKEASARVYLTPGTGKVTVNQREASEYFRRGTLLLLLNQPFELTETEGQYDATIFVRGGGLTGQAGAVKHGLSRALVTANGDFRASLKKAGFLTRDARCVERKKYGQPKARKRFQFSKR